MSRVACLIPIKPTLHPTLREFAFARAAALPLANPTLDITIMYDYGTVPKLKGDVRPWSKVARVRNNMLAQLDLNTIDYVFWIDADVVDYPADLPSQLIAANPDGITAPLVVVEDHGCRFYDWAAYIIKDRSHIEPENRWPVVGRNLAHDPPYWPSEPTEEVVEVDGVGTIYCANADIYRTGIRHADHPAFTDHWPVCERARTMGRKVCVHRGQVAVHANLPKFGEAFH